MGLNQVKNLLYSKGNNNLQHQETTYSYSSNKRLISRIYKELQKLTPKEQAIQ
jgi:hypothetical protein